MQAPIQFNSDEVNPDLVETRVDAVNSTQRARPTRNRQIPIRLNDYEIVFDSTMDEEGEIIHLAILAGVE